MGKRKEIRARLSEAEYDVIKQHRALRKECDKTGIPIEDVNHYWYKGKHYSIHVKKSDPEEKTIFENLKKVLEGQITARKEPPSATPKILREGVLKWSDLHFGAHIRNLVITQDYDPHTLLNGLLKSVQEVNEMGFKRVHVHIAGDLIESFSGLNHINSWMSMRKDLIGAKAVKHCTETLAEALSKINNLGEVKIVAGNHDRISKANDEDVKGGAAELIAWGLDLMGYSVEFHPMIITHQVEGINHIVLHGHLGVSRQSTERIIWDYGVKGKFNFITEGHLHSIIEKLSIKSQSAYKVVKDDAIDFRRMHLPSFFTGNYYSETLGFSTNAGWVTIWDNGNGKPNVLSSAI